VKVSSIDLRKFSSNKFDCRSFKVKTPLINFDEVRKHVWSQLRSVDALELQSDKIVMYEFSTFEDLIKLMKDSVNCNSQNGKALLKKQMEEKLKVDLFKEYRAKLFESLLLLALLGKTVNETNIELRIVICVANKKDISFYDLLKREVKKFLAKKLHSLFPSGKDDKVIVSF